MSTQPNDPAAKLRTKIKARAAEIKLDIQEYVNRETDILNDHAVVSIALLEMALDRYIDLHGPTDARQLIESSFQRAVERSKKRLN